MKTVDNHVFLIHLSEDKIDDIFAKILVNGVMLEPLDPRELGDRWQNVLFLNTIELDKGTTEKMEILEKAINKYSNQFSFEEKYESGRVSKVLENWQEKYLIDAAQKLLVNTIVNKKFLQQKSIIKKVKGGWKVTILKDLKALYTRLEISQKINKIRTKIFRLTNDSNALFCCFIVEEKDIDQISEILELNFVDFEMTTWSKPILFESKSESGILNNLIFEPLDKSFLWIFNIFNIIFASIIVHDILFGLIILLISFVATKFNLRSKYIQSSIWIGFGSMVIGFISGSFGGNLLNVWSVSPNKILKDTALEIINFLSLFKIVDWSNSSSNYLINSFLVDQTQFLYLSVFCLVIGLGVLVGLLGILSKIFKDFAISQQKQGVTGIIYLINIFVGVLVVLSQIPVWSIVIGLFGLFVYQWPLDIKSKLKNFILGRYGILGTLYNIFKQLWFGAIFGLILLSSVAINWLNEYYINNIILQILLNLFFGLFLWQITLVVVQKSLKSNFLNYFVRNANKTNQRYFDPITKYKYWKF